MRAKEFLINNVDRIVDECRSIVTDINGNQDYCNFVTLVESQLSGSSLFEQLSQDQIDYIKSLKSYSSPAKRGNQYAPVLAFLLPDNLKFFGSNQLLTLVDTRTYGNNTVYDFENSDGQISTYPDISLTEKSYGELFLFDDPATYSKFQLAINLKFKHAELPNINFDTSIMEIERIPQGDFGDKDTLAPMREPRSARPLPGNSGYTYAVRQSGRLREIMIFDQDALVAELDLKPSDDSLGSWRVESVATDPDYRGRGLGLALYGIALSLLKLTLRAGRTQTRHGRAMWLKLNSIPGVQVRGIAREPSAEYQRRPGDEIIAQTSKYTTYTFPVKPGQTSMRGARSGRGIYNSDASMIAKWTGS